VAKWAQWTHVPSSVAVYLSNDGGSKWFKIDEAAVLSGTVGGNDWAGNVIIKTGVWSSKVPAGLAPGKYIVRHELIARHQANNPQFYAECAQIEVSGSGGSVPDSSYFVSIPSTAWADPKDSNLNFEVNGSTMPASQYKVTGPKVWDGGSAVVVDDARDPHAAHLDLGAVGEDRRVLERNALLVAEAVGDPPLQLLARELARVHPDVERVEVVVARPLRAQPLDELGRARRGHRRARACH